MNALDTRLNYLVGRLELLRSEEEQLRQKQVTLGKEMSEFFQEHGCPGSAHPIEIIKHFRQRKVLETL